MSSVLKLKKPKIARGIREPNSTIIAVGGGKGGVGKSFLSSNLGIYLASMGHKTLLVDLDFGASNLHTCLGENIPQQGIHKFLATQSKKINSHIADTQIPNLQLFSYDDDQSLSDLVSQPNKQSQLMSALFNHNADYIILDLSAGSDLLTLDFFLMAQFKLVAITPEPSSVENAYKFMKKSFFRCIERYQDQLDLKVPVTTLKSNADKLGIRYPADLLNALFQKDPEKAQELMRFLGRLDFNIVINQTRSAMDANLGHSIKSVCTKYFGLPATFLGTLEFDNAVWQSMRKKRPLILESPQSPLYAQVMGIARQIAASSPKEKKNTLSA